MKPIPFSYVTSRKLALQGSPNVSKISYQTVYNNPNVNNLILFIESSSDDFDAHFRDSIRLYDRVMQVSELTELERMKIKLAISNNLIKVPDIDSVYHYLTDEQIKDKDLLNDYTETIKYLECCDRIIRNESRILKRYDLNKIINESIMHGIRHTVFELCSLLDTYDMSSKAKLNIALENVSYALFKSGHKVDLDEATEYIVEYFLTREAVITDKQYDGYIDVLESNRFIDSSNPNLSYVFEAHKEKDNSFSSKVNRLADQCEDPELRKYIPKVLSIKNEKQASDYIENTIEKILDDDTTVNDSYLLLKSIYILPLIGNISKAFVDYKVELSKRKLKIKKKLTGIENEKIVRDILDDGELIDYVAFVSETVHNENYILDDLYVDETDPVKILEASGTSNEIKDIINTFKASNEKSNGKFKNMISRIMVKSPENIIDSTPNIFGIVRIMLYLGIATTGPLGIVFSSVLSLVNKLLTMHLDVKQAEKLLKHLKSEKEKAEKKLEKLSGKEKDNQKEYIDCIKECIKKVESFISNIDDENEELNNSSDDDDFDFGDFDINFESVVELGELLIGINDVSDILDALSSPLDEEIISNIAVLFDNCPSKVANEFYNKLDELGISTVVKESAKITEDPSFVVQYEAAKELKKINKNIKNDKEKGKSPAINLNTLKMAVVNFKKKFRNLRGKEQELWRNIDIATSRLTVGIHQALTSDRREAIIKGSIIPSFSKCIKFAISVGAIGIFTGPVGAAISAVGMLAASKALNERERRLLYDEIDTELQVVEKQIQLAENEGNMNQYRFLLNYEKKLKREKYRIKYHIYMAGGRRIPELKGDK